MTMKSASRACALLTVALSMLLAGCSTGTAVRLGDVVTAPQLLPPAPPARLLQTPPVADFQTRLLAIFSISPAQPIPPQPTPNSGTSTP